MDFSDVIRNETKWTRTENGQVALNTTNSKCLDLFSTIGALHSATEIRKRTLFEEAYTEDPLLATKIIFYARDVREGLGERQTFRELLYYAAKYHPEAVKENIRLIPFYGRWDDLYFLVSTDLEDDMWNVVKNQLKQDLAALKENRVHDISLCAKWLKTPDASSETTKKIGIYTAGKLGLDVYQYKRILRRLRKALKVVETKMSANKWTEIDYSIVPSKAMTNYRDAFKRHDPDGFTEFTNAAIRGEVKINSSTLFPYDIIEKYGLWFRGNGAEVIVDGDEDTLEAQWRQMPDYISEGTNAIVIADTSGSMTGRPMATALGLAIYFAQHNKGVYHNLWMNFSSKPHFQIIKGETLRQILSYINYSDWSSSTNCSAAFELILKLAVENNVDKSEMPKSLIIISDMEFDSCGRDDWTFYDEMARKYNSYGYEIPNIIFWNVDSRNNVFHADSRRKGVQLVSGQSASTFKQVMGSVGFTPYEMMLKVIDSERYKEVKIV